MRIDKAGEHDFVLAVDLNNFLAIFLQPGIAQCIFGRADGDDFPADAENRGIFDDTEIVRGQRRAGGRVRG